MPVRVDGRSFLSIIDQFEASMRTVIGAGVSARSWRVDNAHAGTSARIQGSDFYWLRRYELFRYKQRIISL